MKDKQILVIVVLALTFWFAAWKHEFTLNLVHNASKRVVGLFHH